MSLITLRSQNLNIPGSIPESTSNIRNFFKESIEFKKGDTFELVSISITKVDNFEIFPGVNDRLVWRIGKGPLTIGGTSSFAQHVVTIPGGSYNGLQLAAVIQRAMNSSVILGVYSKKNEIATDGGFSVIYSEAQSGPPIVEPKFTMTYYQQTLPPSNGDTLQLTKNTEYSPGQLNVIQRVPQNEYLIRTEPFNVSPEFPQDIQTLSSSVFGNKSIFANGGECNVIIKPILGISGFPNLGDSTTDIVSLYNNGTGIDRTVPVIFDTIAPVNGWQYSLKLYDGPPGAISTSYVSFVSGALVTTSILNPGTGYIATQSQYYGNISSLTGRDGLYFITNVGANGEITAYNDIGKGYGYAQGDQLAFANAGNGDGSVMVNTVSGILQGQNYVVNDTGLFTSERGLGTGARYKVLTVGANGQILTFEVLATDAGSGYVVGDLLVFSGNGNGGAKVKVDQIGPTALDYFAHVTTDGVMGWADSTANDATQEANWNKGKFTFDITNNTFDNHAAVGTATRPTGRVTSLDATFNPTTSNQHYCRTMYGICRDQLITGRALYPGNINATINNSDGGFDIQVIIYSDTVNNKLQVEIKGFTQQTGTTYPNPNWRNVKDYLNGPVEPASWNSLVSAPANWTTYQYPEDSIKSRLERYGIDKTRIYISHDTGGDGVFTEEVILLEQGDNNNVAFAPTTREVMYPFTPVLFVAPGSRFSINDTALQGIYDVERYDATGVIVRSLNLNGDPTLQKNHTDMGLDELVYEGATTETTLGGPVAPLTLSSMWKFGLVEFAESNGDNASVYDKTTAGGIGGPGIVTEAGGVQTQLSGRSLNPNDATINTVLGFPRWQIHNQGSQNITIATANGVVPSTNILEPSLMVEFPEFNIRSYSGQSSDTGKAIAVVPREQWTTNEKTGTLIYVAPYPIQIDLNVQGDILLNELTCRLRQADGTLANDLLHPTEITIRKVEGETQKQERIIKAIINGLRS